jgi:very-short-patch-repair endonuclease
MHEDELYKGATPPLFQFARGNRQSPTEAEKLLWMNLRGRRLKGFKFRRQHPLEKFIVDFYCPESRLAIELDGGYHDEAEQSEIDARTLELNAVGIQVIRFKNSEVIENMASVLKKISLHLRPDPART